METSITARRPRVAPCRQPSQEGSDTSLAWALEASHVDLDPGFIPRLVLLPVAGISWRACEQLPGLMSLMAHTKESEGMPPLPAGNSVLGLGAVSTNGRRAGATPEKAHLSWHSSSVPDTLFTGTLAVGGGLFPASLRLGATK